MQELFVSRSASGRRFPVSALRSNTVAPKPRQNYFCAAPAGRDPLDCSGVTASATSLTDSLISPTAGCTSLMRSCSAFDNRSMRLVTSCSSLSVVSCRDEMRCIHQKQTPQQAIPVHPKIMLAVSKLLILKLHIMRDRDLDNSREHKSRLRAPELLLSGLRSGATTLARPRDFSRSVRYHRFRTGLVDPASNRHLESGLEYFAVSDLVRELARLSLWHCLNLEFPPKYIARHGGCCASGWLRRSGHLLAHRLAAR